MKICADSVIFSLQDVGGISTYWSQLLRGLRSQQGIDLSVRLGRANRNCLATSQIEVNEEIFHDLLPTIAARYLPITAGGSDIIHSSYYRIPAPFARSKLVTTVYDFIYERYVTGKAQAVHTVQKGAAIRRSDVILCISHSTRADLLERYPRIDPARVLVTHLSYDRDMFRPVEPGNEDPALKRSVIFVGARGGYKRFDLAVSAVAVLEDVELAIVGHTPDAAETAMLEARLSGRWHALGRLDNEALRLAYASCLALIYPSDYEGFGLPLLEAMACGAPVVTNRNSSLGEVGGDAPIYATAQNGEAYAEALVALLALDTRAAAIQRGLARCAMFDWQRTIDETVAAYHMIA